MPGKFAPGDEGSGQDVLDQIAALAKAYKAVKEDDVDEALDEIANLAKPPRSILDQILLELRAIRAELKILRKPDRI